jgi:hypothetical protein
MPTPIAATRCWQLAFLAGHSCRPLSFLSFIIMSSWSVRLRVLILINQGRKLLKFFMGGKGGSSFASFGLSVG